MQRNGVEVENRDNDDDDNDDDDREITTTPKESTASLDAIAKLHTNI